MQTGTGFKVFEKIGTNWIGIGPVFPTEKDAKKRMKFIARFSPEKNFKVNQLRALRSQIGQGW